MAAIFPFLVIKKGNMAALSFRLLLAILDQFDLWLTSMAAYESVHTQLVLEPVLNKSDGVNMV